MFRFANPEFLLALLPLVALSGAAWWQWRRLQRRRSALADEELLSELSGGLPFGRKWLRWALGATGLALWVVALANPQFGTRSRTAQVKSTEVMFALDISDSMLAEDVRPSRLSRAQAFLLDLLERLDGEQVGLVVFAGQAYLQVPLTTDYGALQLFVRAANPDQAPTQGTNFAAAVALASELLRPEAEEPAVATRRLLVLVSDGENHEPLAAELAEDAAERGVQVLTVGVGTAEGAHIPLGPGGPARVKRDAGGEVVVSKFDPEALRQLAEAGRGRYYDLNGNVAGVVGSIAATIADGPEEWVGEELFEESASYFQPLVLLGLLCWGAAYLVGRHTDFAALAARKPSPAVESF